MADPVEVQRYDVGSGGMAESKGGSFMIASHVAPLMAELATLRERTRRRDAVAEPPPEGVWVLGRVIAPPLVCAVRSTGGKCADQLGWAREIVEWWPLPGEPLPEVSE